MNILIDNRQNKMKYESKLESLMINAIEICLEKEMVSKDVEISITLLDNKMIHELNREYRNIDRETDVLSFPQYESMDDIKIGMCLGDIVISLEKAKEQSFEYGHSFEREVLFLTVHSMFHLMGYDHDTLENTKAMRKKEEEVLGQMGILRE
ncbi:rRNA maturation RNase YbeY [Lutibacter sp. B2]|nr:rRNA maturation RNase YbeY [Lutibacter sp. B2]